MALVNIIHCDVITGSKDKNGRLYFQSCKFHKFLTDNIQKSYAVTAII